jgi:hypothetical protein
MRRARYKEGRNNSLLILIMEQLGLQFLYKCRDPVFSTKGKCECEQAAVTGLPVEVHDGRNFGNYWVRRASATMLGEI